MKIIQALGLVAVCASPAIAQEVQPWGSRDFSSKRISANTGGEFPTLVQIDPTEEPYSLTPQAGEEGTPVIAATISVQPTGQSGWFWNGISPKIADGSPDRLAQAIGMLALSQSDLTPEWDAMAVLVRDFGPLLSDGSQGTRVSPALALAVMAVESSGRTDVVSTAGAQGLMQLMPATAARFDVTDPMVPSDNIGGGIAYLNFLLRSFGNDPILSVAAYNSGEGAVAKHGGVPPFAETRAYVPKVLGAWTMARLFCRVPPENFTDPCAFATLPSG